MVQAKFYNFKGFAWTRKTLLIAFKFWSKYICGWVERFMFSLGFLVKMEETRLQI